MVQLSISVGLANVILWVITEVFVLLLSNNATWLIARSRVNHRLLSKNTIKLNEREDLIDAIPYNGDLFLARPPLKLILTLYRICIVCISVYLGASLDGERELSRQPFPVSSETFLSSTDGALTFNSGDDLNAMAKLSCLRIINNNLVFLYKGYVSAQVSILCEDGNATESENILLKAEIRATFRTPKAGMDISNTPMYTSTHESGSPIVDRTPGRLRVNHTDENGNATDIAARVVLMQHLDEGKCQFGIWRSKGLGFENRVDVKIEAPCTLRIVALDRLLRPKPEFLPPRMSFLFQIVDSVLVSRATKEAPRVREENIVAAFPLGGIVVLGVAILVSAVICLVFGCIIKRGKVKTNLFLAKGIGEVLSGPSGKEILLRWDENLGRVVLHNQYVLESANEADKSQVKVERKNSRRIVRTE